MSQFQLFLSLCCFAQPVHQCLDAARPALFVGHSQSCAPRYASDISTKTDRLLPLSDDVDDTWSREVMACPSVWMTPPASSSLASPWPAELQRRTHQCHHLPAPSTARGHTTINRAIDCADANTNVLSRLEVAPREEITMSLEAWRTI